MPNPNSVRLALLLSTALLLSSCLIDAAYDHHLRRNLIRRRLQLLSSSSPLPFFTQQSHSSRILHATDFGADPTGSIDSTAALSRALSAASSTSSSPPRSLMPSITNLGGPQLHLDGGTYLISSPISLPSHVGNLKIHSGTLRATDTFPSNRYLIELRPPTPSHYAFEYITLSNLMLDANFRGGGIAAVDSLRIIIEDSYIVHFTTNGILIQDGHDNFIRNCYIGQHITAGGDAGEPNYTGTAIKINGNDNFVTDVVIFSAAVGILVSGQANTLTGVHCYNKAAVFGGTGIYLKLPGLTQTRITNCYFDFTGIIAEDPVQLLVSGSFFLGNANVEFKSVNGVIKDVSVVDNIFSGSGSGAHNVWLNLSGGLFTTVENVVVDRNSMRGMLSRSTVARRSVMSKGTMWTVDLSSVLLFPNRIDHVQYSFATQSGFPGHALRSLENNRVVIASDAEVLATVHVEVRQFSGT